MLMYKNGNTLDCMQVQVESLKKNGWSFEKTVEKPAEIVKPKPVSTATKKVEEKPKQAVAKPTVAKQAQK